MEEKLMIPTGVKKIARKIGNKFHSTIKLDTGVNISFVPVLPRGG